MSIFFEAVIVEPRPIDQVTIVLIGPDWRCTVAICPRVTAENLLENLASALKRTTGGDNAQK